MNTKIEKLSELPAHFRKEIPEIKPLSPHQQLILTLFAEVWHTKEISSLLGVSDKTVEFHRSRLFQILGTNSIAMLTRIAIKMGLVKN